MQRSWYEVSKKSKEITSSSSSRPEETMSNQVDSTPNSKELIIKVVKNEMKLSVDLTPLEQHIKNILNQSSPTSIESNVRLFSMQQLCYGFSIFIKKLMPKTQVTTIDSFNPNVQMRFHEKFLIELAKMIMYCQAFVELTLKDKFLIYTYVRSYYGLLERWYSSLTYYNFKKDFKLLLDETSAINIQDKNFIIQGVDKDLMDQITP
uniref:Uncharacterized protein n=1 Tax=Acrobeloides nanus TaxID=290746 RepID=A0A914C2D4_9BILA